MLCTGRLTFYVMLDVLVRRRMCSRYLSLMKRKVDRSSRNQKQPLLRNSIESMGCLEWLPLFLSLYEAISRAGSVGHQQWASNSWKVARVTRKSTPPLRTSEEKGIPDTLVQSNASEVWVGSFQFASLQKAISANARNYKKCLHS